MLLANTLGLLWLTPALFIAYQGLSYFTPSVWLLVVLTGLTQAGYFFALTGTYRSGDLSIAYPVARSTPVILVAIVTILLGHGGQIRPINLFGMLLVTVGGFLLPMKSFADFRLKNYLNRTTLLALATAVCIATYSLIDDQALRILRSSIGLTIDKTLVSILYSLIEAISCSLWLAVFVLISRQERQQLKDFSRGKIEHTFLVGAMIIFAYTLVLIAMGFVQNVSYVLAFRQLSIIFAALLGVLVLKEPGYTPKFTGLAVMFTGLVLVSIR